MQELEGGWHTGAVGGGQEVKGGWRTGDGGRGGRQDVEGGWVLEVEEGSRMWRAGYWSWREGQLSP